MVVSRRFTRHAWARLERRARRAHERDLLNTLRELRHQEPAVVVVDLPCHGRGIRITLIDRLVVLAGVSGRARDIAAELAGNRSGMTLVDGGRYRRGWWLTVSDGSSQHHILGVYLQIVPQGRTDGIMPTGPTPYAQRLSRIT